MKQAKKIISGSGENMLSARAASALLSCAPDYIGKLCREGKLAGERVQGAWFVREDSLRSFMLSRQEARLARSEELSSLRRRELLDSGYVQKKEALAATRALDLPIAKMLAASAAVGFIFIASVALTATLPAARNSLSAALGTLKSPFFARQDASLLIPSTTALGRLFDSLFASKIDFEPKVEPVALPPRETFAVAPAATDGNGVISALASTSSKVQYAIYPVVERTIEKVVVENGISQELLTSIVRELAAGKDGSIQYNDNGHFAASSTALVWDDKLGAFTVAGAVHADLLCLQGVCLTKEQLRSLLSSATSSVP